MCCEAVVVFADSLSTDGAWGGLMNKHRSLDVARHYYWVHKTQRSLQCLAGISAHSHSFAQHKRQHTHSRTFKQSPRADISAYKEWLIRQRPAAASINLTWPYSPCSWAETTPHYHTVPAMLGYCASVLVYDTPAQHDSFNFSPCY